jgi:hypothetical protein
VPVEPDREQCDAVRWGGRPGDESTHRHLVHVSASR